MKFIESELVSLKKEVNEMWTLVYNQLNSYEYVFALLTDRLVGQHLQYTPMPGFKSIFQLCRFY